MRRRPSADGHRTRRVRRSRLRTHQLKRPLQCVHSPTTPQASPRAGPRTRSRGVVNRSGSPETDRVETESTIADSPPSNRMRAKSKCRVFKRCDDGHARIRRRSGDRRSCFGGVARSAGDEDSPRPVFQPSNGEVHRNLTRVNSERITNTIDDTLAERGSGDVRSVDEPKEPTPLLARLERDN